MATTATATPTSSVVCEHADPLIIYAAEKRGPYGVKCRLFGRQQTQGSHADLGGPGSVKYVMSAFVTSLFRVKEHLMPEGNVRNSISAVLPPALSVVAFRQGQFRPVLNHLESTRHTCKGCRTYCDLMEYTQWWLGAEEGRINCDGAAHDTDVTPTEQVEQTNHAVIVLQHVYNHACIVGVTLSADRQLEMLALALGRLGAIPFPSIPTEAHWKLFDDWERRKSPRADISAGPLYHHHQQQQQQQQQQHQQQQQLQHQRRASYNKLGWSTVYLNNSFRDRTRALQCVHTIQSIWYGKAEPEDDEHASKTETLSTQGYHRLMQHGTKAQREAAYATWNYTAMLDIRLMVKELERAGFGFDDPNGSHSSSSSSNSSDSGESSDDISDELDKEDDNNPPRKSVLISVQ
jgi:hypothetical protein